MRATESMRALVISALMACTGLVGCLQPLDPGRVPITLVRVTLGERDLSLDTMQVRSTKRVHARAFAREGYDVGLTSFTYTSSDPDVAVVDAEGVVRAVAPGRATITATTSGGVRGTATVVVIPSTIAYTIPTGGEPGAIGFSPDYTKAYVAAGASSIEFVDAIGFFAMSTVSLDRPVTDVAATAARLYVTHAAVDLVSVVSTVTKEVLAVLPVSGGPASVAARGTRAYVAAPGASRIVVLEEEREVGAIAVDGAPSLVAVSGDGNRLFASVERGAGWSLLTIDAATQRVLGSVPLAARPSDLAVSRLGDRVLVLYSSLGQLADLRVSAVGVATVQRTVPVQATATSIALREGAPSYVVVSGTPLTILDGDSLDVQETIANGGSGRAAVRPDGLFVFVGAPGARAVHVIGL